MKILLVQPSPFEPGRIGLENTIWFCEPVALTSIAAMVPEHEVRILDMRLETEVTLNRVLAEFRPALVGTTSMTTDCYQAKAVLQTAKDTLGDKCFTIVGGHHPTLMPEDFFDPCVDALCVGEGEETFRELVSALAQQRSRGELDEIAGLLLRRADGSYHRTAKRAQIRALDTLPAPARHLIDRYRAEYFFTVAGPMASIATSRGCSFDCNFCAIWEFYERKTRFLSAKVVVDRMEAVSEKFVFFLDDNFLTNKHRLEALCDEIERRGVKKWWGTQGRADFIANNPELMKRLRDAGLVMVLSGYESNDEDALAALLKRSTADHNRRAAALLRELGIFSTGIFMVRQDFSEEDFDTLYAHINDLGIALPLVAILTPLPGTQLYRARRHELLTEDRRLFDLLHSVLPTKLPRRRFYERFAEANRATWESWKKGNGAVLKKRPEFFKDALPGIVRFVTRAHQYRPILESAETHLRDEVGIIDPEARMSPAANEDAKRRLPVLEVA
ncbi:MAG: cobalamin-dependent protein [Myxococcales bacterium]|nr:cobalamin-dependent protein [Myxococcales bacterium]